MSTTALPLAWPVRLAPLGEAPAGTFWKLSKTTGDWYLEVITFARTHQATQ